MLFIMRKELCRCEMVNYIEFLKVPQNIGVLFVGILLVINFIGELLEFKGKVVPEFIKFRKYFVRKKKERTALAKMTVLLDEYQEMKTTISDVRRLLSDIDSHYSKDNIAMRDNWMKTVNDHIVESEERKTEQDALMRELSEKLDKNNADTLSILIDNKRNAIIDFAYKVIDESYPVTKEQFNRIFKIYKEYEEIIEQNGLTNGEIDINIRIIREAYEKHLKSHTFIEDVRGYNI